MILFTFTGLNFCGEDIDYKENAALIHNAIDILVNAFIEECYKNPNIKHHITTKINKNYSLSLLWNSENKLKCYLMFYERSEEPPKRCYSVNIKDIMEIVDIAQNLCPYMENALMLSQYAINNGHEKDLWQLNDLQSFADNIDKFSNIDNDDYSL